jgi:hypothetical protein
MSRIIQLLFRLALQSAHVPYKLTVEISVTSSTPILSIKSPSYPITVQIEQNTKKAQVSLDSTAGAPTFDKDLELLISVADPHSGFVTILLLTVSVRVWVEHGDDNDVIAFALYPDYNSLKLFPDNKTAISQVCSTDLQFTIGNRCRCVGEGFKWSNFRIHCDQYFSTVTSLVLILFYYLVT